MAVTVYQVIVDGKIKETCGTWSQANNSIDKYKKCGFKNVDYREVKK